MKPEIALKIDYSPFEKYTRDGIEALRDEWISLYREIAFGNEERRQLCELLSERISRAADLFIERHVGEPKSEGFVSHDDYYYEWLEETRAKENASLDGEFPLGNEVDMKFASPYFSLAELASIQMGCALDIYAGYYVEYADRVLVRRGILAEMMGKFNEAVSAYSGVSSSKEVQKREYACRRKLNDG